MLDCITCCAKADRAKERNFKNPDYVTCGFPGSDWYPLGAIRYCPPQILWCMATLEMLEDGDYPMRQSGYEGIDPSVRVPPRAKALNDASELYLEISVRLERVPDRESRLFKRETRPEIDIEALNKHKELKLKRVRIGDLSYSSKRVLEYLSWDRKAMGYQDWLKQKEYRARQKNLTTLTTGK